MSTNTTGSSAFDLAAVREKLKRAKAEDTPQAVIASWEDVEPLIQEVERLTARHEWSRPRVAKLIESIEKLCAEKDRLTAENATLSRWLDRNITTEDAMKYALCALMESSAVIATKSIFRTVDNCFKSIKTACAKRPGSGCKK